MSSETCDYLDPRQAFIGEVFDDGALFKFYDFGAFCPMDPFLPSNSPDDRF
jgi:hypothetical protein